MVPSREIKMSPTHVPDVLMVSWAAKGMLSVILVESHEKRVGKALTPAWPGSVQKHRLLSFRAFLFSQGGISRWPVHS